MFKMKQRIKLKHIAMNVEYAEVADLIIKLEYVISDSKKPKLEIFKNTEKAQKNDWKIYGFGPSEYNDPEGEKVYQLRFNGLNEVEIFEFDDKKYKITFIHSGKEEYQYAKTKEEICFYEFEIERTQLDK